jgi:hypothetical protein
MRAGGLTVLPTAQGRDACWDVWTMQLLTGAELDGNVTLRYCHITYLSCDKPLTAKVFLILYPSRVDQLKFNNAQGLWI